MKTVIRKYLRDDDDDADDNINNTKIILEIAQALPINPLYLIKERHITQQEIYVSNACDCYAIMT